MQRAAAQRFLGAVFANGCLDQRRAGQVNAGAALHQNHIVRQPGHVSPARRGRAMHHGKLRYAGGRQPRLVGKTAPAVNKNVGLVHQVGAARLHQRNQRQLVLQGNGLRAQAFFEAHGRDGAALDPAVTGGNQHPLAADLADADNRAAPLHRSLAVIVMHAQSGQRAQLQKAAAPVKQTRHPLARQQLAFFLELFAFGAGFNDNPVLQRLHLGQAPGHAFGVGAVGGAARIEQGAKHGHGLRTSGVCAR